MVVHGEVADAKDFLNQHQITIVPLLSGSGMRAKILEAMALGRIVLTTSLGLEGIPATADKEVLIADSKEEFLDLLTMLQEHPHKLDQISKAAQAFVAANFCHLNLAEDLTRALSDYRSEKERLSAPSEMASSSTVDLH
jgi:hypothetical protein